MLYYESVSQCFFFISGNRKNNFFCIFSHFSSYLTSLQTFEMNFPKSADFWLIQTQHIFHCKINTIEVFWFLISITLVFSSLTIWYPTVVYNCHSVKSVRIWGYSGPHFPAFGLNTERYSVSLRVQSECGKIRTRITPNTDTFYIVSCFNRNENSFGNV